MRKSFARLRSAAGAALAAAAGVALAVCVTKARALDVPSDEWDRLKVCEKRICTMILSKDPKGDDLKCDLSKTWAKSSLEGGKSKGISWAFGDARCTANVVLSRADIVGALTQPKYTINVRPQTVKCVLERDGQIKPVKITLAPKLVFKDGKADKVWINLKDMDGPDDVKGTVWTAASLEDTLGIFHRPLIKSINKFMYEQCPKRYGPAAVAAEAKAEAAKAKSVEKVEKKEKPAAASPAPPVQGSAVPAPAAKASDAADAKPAASSEKAAADDKAAASTR